MRKDKGLSTDLDRLPQLIWMMFLKFLDDLDVQDETAAVVSGTSHRPLVPAPYRWRDWASKPDGITGDELLAFVNNDEATRPDGSRGPGLFTTLRGLESTSDQDRRGVVARVFQGTNNRMLSGYLMREVLNKIEELRLTSSDELHTLSALYETMLAEIRDAAKSSGEFYTPRPLVRFMVSALAPVLGEVVLDPACGTAGFLVESYEYLKKQVATTADRELLQSRSLFGGEAKALPYLLGEMNLLLHGVHVPNIDYANSLAIKVTEIGDSERVDVILTNPPFGGEEEASIKSNFPRDLQTSETALLFLQLIMRRLRRPSPTAPSGGRAAVVVPNGMLSGDGVCARVKAQMLQDFNLHTVVRLPVGVFSPYTPIPTNVLFFDRSHPTGDMWFYEHPLPDGRKSYTKTKPLRFIEFQPLLEWWNNREESEHAWKVGASDVLEFDSQGGVVGCNLDLRNPRSTGDDEAMLPAELLSLILDQERRIVDLIEEVRDTLEARK